MTTNRELLARDLEILEIIDDDGVGLTEWEISWLDNNLKRVANGTLLTKDQRKKAYEIKEERCGA